MMNGETTRPESDMIAALGRMLGELGGLRLVDVGCGRGGLARKLTAEGATVLGVEPNPEALARARAAAPDADLREGGAESLPFPDDAADAAIFSNSLHHVPPPLMRRALSEALRVAPCVAVLEPLAEGGWHEAARPMVDETAIRARALDSVAGALADGEAVERMRFEYVAYDRSASYASFVDAMVGVDPARAALLETVGPALRAAYHAHARRHPEGGALFDAPMIAIALARA